MVNRIFLVLAIVTTLGMAALLIRHPSDLTTWMIAMGTMLFLIWSLLPGKTRISRSITVVAPASAVFGQVNELKTWGLNDPLMTLTYSGPPAGTGRSCHWVGSRRFGEGMGIITESRPNELVQIKLNFLKPFPGVFHIEFTFRESHDATIVNWVCVMEGTVPILGLFLKRQIGRQLGQTEIRSGETEA